MRQFPALRGFIIIGKGVVVRDSFSVLGARVGFLVGNDVHRRIEFACEISINGAISACVMPEPVQ